MTLPGPLAPTKTTTIATTDGALYAEIFMPAEAPRGIVLITHGYAEHCGRYHEVAHVIVNAGWAAISYDVRGHGRSPGSRATSIGFRPTSTTSAPCTPPPARWSRPRRSCCSDTRMVASSPCVHWPASTHPPRSRQSSRRRSWA